MRVLAFSITVYLTEFFGDSGELKIFKTRRNLAYCVTNSMLLLRVDKDYSRINLTCEQNKPFIQKSRGVESTACDVESVAPFVRLRLAK